jgi:hypothetical protein
MFQEMENLYVGKSRYQAQSSYKCDKTFNVFSIHLKSNYS